MTLIEIVEDRQAELETELRMCREILVILRGGKSTSGPLAKGLRHGPIVYGNGHHDGTITKRGTLRKSPPSQGMTGLTEGRVRDILRAHPQGLTLAQIQAILAQKYGSKISASSVYAPLREKLKAERVQQSGSPAFIYKLPQ